MKNSPLTDGTNNVFKIKKPPMFAATVVIQQKILEYLYVEEIL